MPETDAIAATNGLPATIDSLTREFAALGIPRAGTLIVHSSLRALGYVVGGPVTVIAALEHVLGPDGTLAMPTFTGQLTDPGGWIAPPVPEPWWPVIREHEPAFDPAATPTRIMGAIPELFRTLPGTERSHHPHVSFAARGWQADRIVAAHELADSLGETSPLARLYELDLWVLLLGVGHANNSSIHLAEYRTRFPTRRRAQKSGPIRRDGHRVWASYDDIEFDTGDFIALGDAFAATGAERTGGVALATARLMRQRALVDFAVSWMERDAPAGMIAAIVIFAATYLVVAVGRVPGLRLDRAGAALIGAGLMVAVGALSPAEAYRAIDLDTLALLLGMMIVVANLRLSGFFALCHGWIARRAHRPLALLIGVVVVAGVLSAVLVNDTVCLMLTPLVIETTRAVKRNPVPYLLALAMASNAGSTATIIGNPQNMMIGSFSHIAYGDFAAQLVPIAAMALVVVVAAVALSWRHEFLAAIRFAAEAPSVAVDRTQLLKSVAVAAAIIAACFLGVCPALAAMLGGSLLFLTRRVEPRQIYAEIDWSLLLLFVGLFVVVAGMQKAVLTPELVRDAGGLPMNQTSVLALITSVLSNLVSNVPAVLVLKPFVATLADPRHGWLVLAMASTLAGNFTILGSVANLIVVQGAERHGIRIGFGTYFAVGARVTLVTLVIGILWLSR